MEKILNSNTLWATHFAFLNDRSEINFGATYIYRHVYRFLFSAYKLLYENKELNFKEHVDLNGGLMEAIRHDASMSVKHLYQVIDEFYLGYFISSFCYSEDTFVIENGLLSQWRAYGKQTGVAIEFDFDKLASLLNLEKESHPYIICSLEKVVYDETAQELDKEFAQQLQNITVHETDIINAKLQSRQWDFISSNESTLSCLNIISRLKHQAFKEEREIRIIAIPAEFLEDTRQHHPEFKDVEEKPINYFQRLGVKIPYIDLFAKIKQKNPDFQLPISRIIVGPSQKQSELANYLKVKLRHTDIVITLSQIPYVEQNTS